MEEQSTRPPRLPAARKPRGGARRAGRPGRSRLTGAEIETLYARLKARMPEPKGELEAVNPYTLLVAVVLSAQATDAGVNKATRPLFAVVDTPETMLALGETRLVEAIRTIGLFNTKAKNVMALSRILVERFGGAVPRDRETLQSLPGVGRKTANVVLNVAFGQPTIAVDTHAFRVANRTGLAPGKDPDAVEAVLERVTPDRFKLHAHHWLILHGRYVCVARKPKCPECVIADICRFKEKTQPAGALAPLLDI
jgi:endonuclease-3